MPFFCITPRAFSWYASFYFCIRFVSKFSNASFCGLYKRAFNEWKDNHVYLTELVMVLNHKIWQWYETNDAIARLYDTLWREADLWAQENLKGEELEYFYRITD